MSSKEKPTEAALTRREFAAATTVGAASLLLAGEATEALAQTATEPSSAMDLAEWSYFWVGVQRAKIARGTVVNGTQMYVESFIPKEVKHPYPIVMVHGGGGQGLDWMGTGDGRPGWSTYLVQQGYKVYVVDRPGHGRSPFHTELDGPFPRQATTFAGIERQFTAPEKNAKPYGPQAKLHTQWPGEGTMGDPTVDQVIPGQGGSFLADFEAMHNVWRNNLSELFDKIGPAIIMMHSQGGPSGWIIGDARPNLVKGIVGIEPGGPPLGNFKWGLTASKVTFDPPANEPTDIKWKKIAGTEPGADACFIQEEPARQLVNLKNIPIAVITSPASYHAPYDWGSVAFLRQAGCKVDHIKLADKGINGNAHFMMMEKNNREVLQVVLDWLPANVEKGAAVKPSTPNETAVKVGEMGHFWVGVEHKKMEYGTIVRGQMFVQYLIPAQVKHANSVVLVHGGGGQGLHYMGTGDGLAGWAHYYVQEGYKTYVVDRPGHGRAPYHPDALGPMGEVPIYESLIGEFQKSKQWPGIAQIGDRMIDQYFANMNAAPLDNAMAHRMWARDGAELLDRIGPAIIQVHSAAGPYGWLVADQRPNLVKCIVCVEGAGNAFAQGQPWGLTDIPIAYDPPVSDPKELATKDVTPPEGSGMQPYKIQAEPARKLKNLKGIPIVVVASDLGGRTQTPAAVAYLKQAGCDAESLQLRDKGIFGNGHFMMLERNRREVFDAIRGWVEVKLKA